MSCKKLVEIDHPKNSITTSAAFADDQSAVSAVLGIYSQLDFAGLSLNFGNSALTVCPGLSSDELNSPAGTSPYITQFQENNLTSDNRILLSGIWQQAYAYLYQTNACLEGLANSTGISGATKRQLTGECKFIRAFCHFYLVNLFGDVPLVTTSDWTTNGLIHRSPLSDVYAQIIGDLNDAQSELTPTYPSSEPTRVNKYAATALLARVYLYTKNWPAADSAASRVINSQAYSLVPDPNHVFLADCSEAIWQVDPTQPNFPYNVTQEAEVFNPGTNPNPSYYLTNNLLAAFEPNDQRYLDWIDSISYLGQTYYYPYKYKNWQGQTGNPTTEYYMMLRLSEQYLIRAEARAEQSRNIPGSMDDLNMIRTRAGLPNTSASDEISLLQAIQHERQIEFFCEWGHRWFDLKRTSTISVVLAPIKTGWQASDSLYPIPLSELQKDPNLTQNPNY